MRRPLTLALLLTSCGLVDDLDKALDDSPPPDKVYHIPKCAADTVRFERCGVTFSEGGR